MLLLIILLLLSAFFSGSETALFSLSNYQRKKIELKHPFAYKSISLLLKSPRRTLASILIGNMLVNIAATSIVTIITINFLGEKGLGLSIIIMVFALLIIGEVTPKTFALKRAESFSLFCGEPLYIFSKAIWPLRKFLRLTADIFISLFVYKKETKPYVTQDELKVLMSISKKEGIIEEDEEEMIRTIFDFGERPISEIMTPRINIIGCEKSFKGNELIRVMKESKHTKIPIFEKTIDNIIGIVYTKEFMLHPAEDFSSFIRKPLYVPEVESIDEVLISFQKEKVYIGVVLDEFGGVAGIVTLEDILEELVGEIKNEFDKGELPIEKEKERTYVVLGTTSIRDINEELGVDLPMKDVTTLNGLLLLLFGRVPQKGEFISLKSVLFCVLEVKKNMVAKARVCVSSKER